MPLPAKNDLPGIPAIEGTLEETSRRLLQSALDQLADHGIAIGAQVSLGCPGRAPKTYRITRIVPSIYGFSREPSGITLYCYGVQLRVGGSWGTHEHSIARPHELTLAASAATGGAL
jgi:hypothetical protein